MDIIPHSSEQTITKGVSFHKVSFGVYNSNMKERYFYYDIKHPRMNLAKFLAGMNNRDISGQLDLLIDGVKTIIVHSSDRSSGNMAHGAVNEEKFQYYHHDVKNMYQKWRNNARTLFKNKKEVFSDEFKEFEAVDSVSEYFYMEERADFPSDFAFRLLEKINRETLFKARVLERAKEKWQAYLKSNESHKLQGLPNKSFCWEDVVITFNLENEDVARISIKNTKFDKEFHFDELGFSKASAKGEKARSGSFSKAWSLLRSIALLKSSKMVVTISNLKEQGSVYHLKSVLGEKLCSLFDLEDDPIPFKRHSRSGGEYIPKINLRITGDDLWESKLSYDDRKNYVSEDKEGEYLDIQTEII